MKTQVMLLSMLTLLAAGCASDPNAMKAGAPSAAPSMSQPAVSASAAAAGPTRAEVRAQAIAAMRAGEITSGFATAGPLQGGR